MKSLLSTAYKLPYSVSHSVLPMLSRGLNIRVTATLKNDVTDDDIQELDSNIIAFFMLASTGALCGSQLPAAKSQIDDHVSIGGYRNSASWKLKVCNVDDRALSILAQLFLTTYEKCPITNLSIVTEGIDSDLFDLSYDEDLINPYPAVVQHPPFSLIVDPDIFDSYSVYARFLSPLVLEQISSIENELMTWATATAIGCYGVADKLPQNCSIQLDKPLISKNDLEWSIERTRAHYASMHGLINVFAAIHSKIAPIESVELSE